jgi:hypothetical protein
LRAVRDGRWELTTLEERNVEAQVKHVLEAVVDVNSTFLFLKALTGISGREEKTKTL